MNCDRLSDKRKLLLWNMEKNKKFLRDKGVSPAKMPEELVRRYFGKKWPEFFTTLRCLLGAAAEDYLESIDYQG